MLFMNASWTLLSRSRLRARIIEHRPAMYRVAYAWSHDRSLAEDLVHDALVKALEHGSTVRDPKRFKAWLFVVMGNCFRDHLRRTARLRYSSDDEMAALILDDPTEPAVGEINELATRVQNAIASLPVGQRQVVTLIDIEGFGYAEVAHILKIPIGTVMSRVSRARARLREQLIEIEPAGIVRLRCVK